MRGRDLYYEVKKQQRDLGVKTHSFKFYASDYDDLAEALDQECVEFSQFVEFVKGYTSVLFPRVIFSKTDSGEFKFLKRFLNFRRKDPEFFKASDAGMEIFNAVTLTLTCMTGIFKYKTNSLPDYFNFYDLVSRVSPIVVSYLKDKDLVRFDFDVTEKLKQYDFTEHYSYIDNLMLLSVEELIEFHKGATYEYLQYKDIYKRDDSILYLGGLGIGEVM